MCRLFGLSAAPARTHATFWLLDAPDSLTQQSHGNPDGTGLGTFSVKGTPRLDRQPLPAFADQRFAQEAQHRESTTFLAHIRHASTGALEVRNTHPFEQTGRLFAHNGVLGGLPALEDELGDYRDLVAGDTDSERFFALITKRIDAHAGDITAGIASAARWVAETPAVFHQPDPDDPDRAMGTALPGHQRLVCPTPRSRRPARRSPSRTHRLGRAHPRA